MPAFAQGLAAGVKAMAKSITRTAGPHLKGMNPPRWVTGFVLFFLLVAVVILILAFAHTWALQKSKGRLRDALSILRTRNLRCGSAVSWQLMKC